MGGNKGRSYSEGTTPYGGLYWGKVGFITLKEILFYAILGRKLKYRYIIIVIRIRLLTNLNLPYEGMVGFCIGVGLDMVGRI